MHFLKHITVRLWMPKETISDWEVRLRCGTLLTVLDGSFLRLVLNELL